MDETHTTGTADTLRLIHIDGSGAHPYRGTAAEIFTQLLDRLIDALRHHGLMDLGDHIGETAHTVTGETIMILRGRPL